MQDAGLVVRVALFLLSFGAIGFFSGSEAAFLGADKWAVLGLSSSGDARARTLASLMESRENTLSAILIGTNVFTVLASVMSASVASLYGVRGATGLAIVSLGTTAIIFVFAELTVKSYLSANATEVALRISGLLYAVTRWLAPAASAMSHIPLLLSRSFVPKAANARAESDSAVRVALDMAGDEGGVDREDSEVIVGVLDSSDTLVSDVMTPLSRAVRLSPDDTLGDVLAGFAKHRFSRIPVISAFDSAQGAEASERVEGIVYLKDAIRALRSEGLSRPVSSIMRPPFFVSRSDTVLDLLARMKKSRVHLAVVTEGQRHVGLATMDDLLGEILGDIRDDPPKKPDLNVSAGNWGGTQTDDWGRGQIDDWGGA